jgi:dGTP triphosphohydrolase
MQRKSQLLPAGDPRRRTRLIHTLEVSRIATEISRKLGIDPTLTEAIALGHDLANCAYGAVGNKELEERSAKRSADAPDSKPHPFRHEEAGALMAQVLSAHSVEGERKSEALALINDQGAEAKWQRDVDLPFKLSLTSVGTKVYESTVTWELVDGIRQHSDGEPHTLEGQVVKIADELAYLSQDVDDLLRTGILKENDFEIHRQYALKIESVKYGRGEKTWAEINQPYNTTDTVVDLKGLFSRSSGQRIGTMVARFVDYSRHALAHGLLTNRYSPILDKNIPCLKLDDGFNHVKTFMWAHVIEPSYETSEHLKTGNALQRSAISKMFDLLEDPASHLRRNNESIGAFMTAMNSTWFVSQSERWKIAYLIAHLSWDEVTMVLERHQQRDYNFIIDIVGDAILGHS